MWSSVVPLVLIRVSHNLAKRQLGNYRDHSRLTEHHLQHTSHLSSSLLSPHPSTPLHRIAVDRHNLLSQVNVPFGQVCATCITTMTHYKDNGIDWKVTYNFRIFPRLHHFHLGSQTRHYRRRIVAYTDRTFIATHSCHRQYLQSTRLTIDFQQIL